jgi:hypothetical protein
VHVCGVPTESFGQCLLPILCQTRQLIKSRNLIWLDKADKSWSSKKQVNEIDLVTLLNMMTMLQQSTTPWLRKQFGK